jgi:histidine kinase
VWVIDDDPHVCAASRALLERWGCEVLLADGPQAALQLARPQPCRSWCCWMCAWAITTARCCTRRWPSCGRPPAGGAGHRRARCGIAEMAAERGWGMMAKPVKPPALRALMSQLLIRHRG